MERRERRTGAWDQNVDRVFVISHSVVAGCVPPEVQRRRSPSTRRTRFHRLLRFAGVRHRTEWRKTTASSEASTCRGGAPPWADWVAAKTVRPFALPPAPRRLPATRAARDRRGASRATSTPPSGVSKAVMASAVKAQPLPTKRRESSAVYLRDREGAAAEELAVVSRLPGSVARPDVPAVLALGQLVCDLPSTSTTPEARAWSRPARRSAPCGRGRRAARCSSRRL